VRKDEEEDKQAERPSADILVGDSTNTVKAIFNTRSKKTTLNEVYDRIRPRPPPLYPSKLGLTTANGGRIQVRGKAIIRYYMGETRIAKMTPIVFGLALPCIIGMDYLEKEIIKIDPPKKSI
jgi:hypothetical protein